MTPLLWFALSSTIGADMRGLGVPNAQAGWEYNETARPKKRKSLYPKPAPAAPEATNESAVLPESRVQVFGKPVREMSADDYAKMLKEDAAAAGRPIVEEAPAEAPVAAEAPKAPSDDAGVDSEFEALRSRIRSRHVAENEGETASDYEPAPAPKKATARSRAASKPKSAASPKSAPAYIPPPPPMETETITPQRRTESAVEPESAARGNEVNAAFGFTHLLPSPFNVPGGTWALGTSVAYGVFDYLQVSTNVVRLVNQYWNVQAKVPLVEYPTFIASAYVDYENFNPHHYEDTNPDVRLKRWLPGLVTGYEITPDIAFFIGGNFAFGQKSPTPVTTTSGYLHGAQANMEWSWLYNPSTSRLGNNAISLGVKYDFTYDLFGLGFTHHWRSFDAGLHYTFADRNRFLPIFGFSVGANF
ncbi:MAG: hypothetical protein JST04_02945 [Bdellovibrionales bacterium]|nr:hypothetical protein [Bdellovibrionales bacterium]